MDSKVVRAEFGSGLICPRAQTCCAELRRLARLANSPGFKSFHCPRWRIKFSLERFSDSVMLSFACPAAGKFSRASSAGDRRHLRSNSVNRIVSVAEDCLSPERTFHGCTLMRFRCSIPLFDSVVRFRCSIPLFDSVAVSVADFSAQNLQLISLPSSQGQQRTHIQAQPASGD
jgi:hypothetical protein